MKNYIIFIIVGINFLLLPNLGIKYIHSQESDILTSNSINQTRFSEGNGDLDSINDTKRVSEILTPDSKNESRFSDNNKYGSLNNSTKVSEVLTPDSINQTRFSED